MSYQTIAELLQKLRNELNASDLDEQSLSLLKQFDSEIQSALSDDQEPSLTEASTEATESLTDTAKRLETHFAAEHPVAETALREIVNALARMGI